MYHLLYLLQALLLLPMMVLLAIYIFIKPFKMFYINLLESIVLADVVLLFLISSTDNFKVISSVATYICLCDPYNKF